MYLLLPPLERRACSLFNTLQELVVRSDLPSLRGCEFMSPKEMAIKNHQSDRLCYPWSLSFRSDASGCIEIERFFLNFTPVSFIREYLTEKGSERPKKVGNSLDSRCQCSPSENQREYLTLNRFQH
jgi:hypothetical protein